MVMKKMMIGTKTSTARNMTTMAMATTRTAAMNEKDDKRFFG
jgi:hypothetical protein